MIPPPAIKEALRQRALALGFDDCRFTTADPPASLPQFRQWLADGRHGEMHYLSRGLPKRANPGSILPGVRSIIVLAAAHHPAEMPIHQGPVGPTVDAALTGYVARYARHPDYHRLLAKPLHELAQTADRLGGPGTRSLAYVDTGPILERDLAQRAGLGFVGKHTNLIRRRAGNWFFLAEVLTTLELPADPSEHNRCGQCTRCLAACPTRAITAPFQLDARLCIAYLTIEFRGIIPHELRPAMGCRIFGCDDCLEVCPWNRFAQTGRLLQSTLRPDLVHPNLLELLSLDDDAFRHRFRDTPLWRARRPGLRRNVCIALGNLKDPRALPALERATHDPQPVVAEAARWALDQIASPAGPTPANPRPAAL
jgi:epoxyqueuosine reductase